MEWVSRLPEVGGKLKAKAKRVEKLREEARQLEDEVCATVSRLWSDAEVKKAKS
jgi:hypothetical protein